MSDTWYRDPLDPPEPDDGLTAADDLSMLVTGEFMAEYRRLTAAEAARIFSGTGTPRGILERRRKLETMTGPGPEVGSWIAGTDLDQDDDE